MYGNEILNLFDEESDFEKEEKLEKFLMRILHTLMKMFQKKTILYISLFLPKLHVKTFNGSPET